MIHELAVFNAIRVPATAAMWLICLSFSSVATITHLVALRLV
jgi:hypothetical protein